MRTKTELGYEPSGKPVYLHDVQKQARILEGRNVRTVVKTILGGRYTLNTIVTTKGKRKSRYATPGITPHKGQAPLADEFECERYPTDEEIERWKDHQRARWERKAEHAHEAGEPEPKRPPYASWLVSETIAENATDSTGGYRGEE